DAIVITSDSELQLEDVVRLTEKNLLSAVGSWFKSVYDHVKRIALQRRDECFPVTGNKLGATAHRRSQCVNHLLFVSDVTIRSTRIRVDVRCAARRICAPTESLLGIGSGTKEKQEYDEMFARERMVQ